jgi:GNAT superfamily N-acetyltransferase
VITPIGRRPPARPAVVLRVVAAVLAVGLVLLALAGPAAADGASPTDTASEVTAVAPPTDVVTARILGGDSFVELVVAPGHEVVVTGYQGEPYLRFSADGRVALNRSSPAAYLNERRNGSTPVPAAATAGAPPDWTDVGGGGRYTWHDHRTHWMAPGQPPSVQPWQIALEVDGRAVATGALNIQERIGLLAGASTIPEFRKKGAQRALLSARLRYAADAGCDLAMMGAEAGSGSQRNAERQGFRIAYTRVKWRRD